MERYLMISDAAKEVQVESHVLRYWEEELHLPIRRNELGHRYYTEDDVELFKQIKSMKEGGLQLKAIKMILKDGKLNVMVPEEDGENSRYTDGNGGTPRENKETKEDETEEVQGMAIQIIGSREVNPADRDEREEKAKRLQWLLQQLIRETLQENNRELCREIKESVVKELDYQFRAQEEREEERSRIREKREEEHYQKLDELLRKKSRGAKIGKKAAGKKKEEETGHASTTEFEEKKAEATEEKKIAVQAGEKSKKEEKGESVENWKTAENRETAAKTASKKKSGKEKVRKKKYFVF